MAKDKKAAELQDVFKVTVEHDNKQVTETISIIGNERWLASSSPDHPAYELMQKLGDAAKAAQSPKQQVKKAKAVGKHEEESE